MKKLVLCSAILAAVGAGIAMCGDRQAEACTPPPCVMTGPIVVTVQGNSTDFSLSPQSLNLPISFHNVSSQGCIVEPVTMSVMLRQNDAFMDIMGMSLIDFPPLPFTVPADGALSGTLQVDIPPSAFVGTRTIEVDVMGTPVPRVERFDITIDGDIVANDVSEDSNVCAMPGTPIQKTFQVTNRTGAMKTVDYLVTSKQNSTTMGTGDHFPIAECGQPLGAGNPYDPVPPMIMDSVNVAPGATVDVCIVTRSFPGCHPGSNCGYLFLATDRATGVTAAAGSAYTVVSPIWGGCAGCIQGIACGDGDADGFIDILDSLIAAQVAAGFSVQTDAQGCWLDVNADGLLNILDALVIAQYSVALPAILTCPFP